MKRLLATMRCDITLQWRHGFYYATAFVLIFCVVAVSRMPTLELGWLLPALVLGNLLLNTFYFIGGLILLEKAEGTLKAQVVTPLRPGEYLTAKVITLTLLGLVENVVLVLLLAGFNFRLLPLAASLILTAVLYCLVGVLAVVRYDSINEYLLPSVVYTALLLVPLMPYLGQWDHWLFYLHPMQAPLLLAQAAFQPVARWQLVYGVLYAALWTSVLGHFSRRALRRCCSAGAGGSLRYLLSVVVTTDGGLSPSSASNFARKPVGTWAFASAQVPTGFFFAIANRVLASTSSLG